MSKRRSVIFVFIRNLSIISKIKKYYKFIDQFLMKTGDKPELIFAVYPPVFFSVFKKSMNLEICKKRQCLQDLRLNKIDIFLSLQELTQFLGHLSCQFLIF